MRSTRLSVAELDQLFDAVETALGRVVASDPQALVGRVERFRGDGWQVALRHQKWALRSCLLVRAHIRALSRKFETRAMIGIGEVSHFSTTSLAESTGEAFRLSGQGLDLLKRPQLFDISASTEDADRVALASALLALCDFVSHRWTQKQAAVFALALDPEAPGQREIGDQMRPPIKQQSVGGHYISGGGPALVKALGVFERQFS